MASSTWLGSSEPEVQAEPEDAQMPLSSSSNSSDSPSMPSKQKLTLPGSLRSASPLSAECGMRKSPAISRSRSAVIFALSRSMFRAASSRAAARPAMPAVFSVPARLPRSCAPPSMRLVSAVPRLA